MRSNRQKYAHLSFAPVANKNTVTSQQDGGISILNSNHLALSERAIMDVLWFQSNAATRAAMRCARYLSCIFHFNLAQPLRVAIAELHKVIQYYIVYFVQYLPVL